MEEQNYLQPRPDELRNRYEIGLTNIRSTGWFCRDSVIYSAPSHLSGEQLKTKLYPHKIELFHKGRVELRIDRVKPGNPDQIRAVIDFRHWLDMFHQKPQAFDDHEYRDEFFPSPEYQQLYQLALTKMNKIKACHYLMAVLQITKQQNCVAELATAIGQSLQQDQLPMLEDLQTQFGYQAMGSKPAVEPARKKRSAQQRAHATIFPTKNDHQISVPGLTSNSFIQFLLMLCFAMVQIIIGNDSSQKQLSPSTMQDLVHTSVNRDLLQQLSVAMSASKDHNNDVNSNHLEQSSTLLPKLFHTMLDNFQKQQQGQIVPSLVSG